MPETEIPTPERRVAVVTGANHGIGAATAIALAADGVDVLLTYLRLGAGADHGLPATYDQVRAADADGVVSAIGALPGRAVALEIDLTAPGAPAAVFDAAEQRLGPVSILVNNASGWQADTFAPDSVDRLGRRLVGVGPGSIERNLGVDARAAALLIAELARRHIARGAKWGRIVGLTSSGRDGFPQEVSYGAAKAAMESYTLSAASELARFGITANVVHPPITDTGWVSDELRTAIGATPDQRVATPAEVAAVVAWLCSDGARLVTGNVIRMR